MSLFDPVAERLAFLKLLDPRELKRLSDVQLHALVQREALRSRARVAALEASYPSAGTRELAQRLVDHKKGLAGMLGGVSGVFGLIGLPADLLAVAYLQITLLVDVATLYKANLKTERARTELLDLFGYASGAGPITRSGPKVVGTLGGMVLARGGLKTLGRALPLVAAPVSAYLNNQALQAVGEQAVRHYEGFGKARQKAKRAAT
ncbi:hypothetical protein FGE12_03835 [Aggregicoccus sp. 17bor-14]|uniref:EcsC family protein n=1 Tax=Myxococcaceae TaxID=31 RepID=UPI00129D0230|nr:MULTISPECIES: EcsC family protein [Myxococcaceae]MBF5041505.1 hypothetical protein [Simulacricoccus sp. 17bor-14]MRI87289.1 hypothetical protein [Aggregicoccus sp. 17bor-14]